MKVCANNGMQRAKIRKGQTNLLYSKWSPLEYAVECAQHAVCGKISTENKPSKTRIVFKTLFEFEISKKKVSKLNLSLLNDLMFHTGSRDDGDGNAVSLGGAVEAIPLEDLSASESHRQEALS